MDSAINPESLAFLDLPSGGDFRASRPLRICLATYDAVGPIRNGGVGTAFTSLAEVLAAAGHEVTLLFLSGAHCENESIGHWIKDYQARGIRLVPLPGNFSPPLEAPFHMAKSYEAYHWLRDGGFDLVHFSEWRGGAYYSVLAKHQGLAFERTRFVVQTHGPTLWSRLGNGEYLNSVEDLVIDFMERESVRLADVVVSPSRYLFGWMKQQGWASNEHSFVQQNILPRTARAPASDGSRQPRPVRELVFFGRLEVRKGLRLFCDALDQLRPEPACQNITVTFLGKLGEVNDQGSAEYLQDRAARWPWKWEIVSDRDQAGAMAYLKGPGRLAIIPSLVDNLPYTVMECLGAQIPFLASDVGGIPELIAAEDFAATCFPLRATVCADKIRRAVEKGVRLARFAVDPAVSERGWIDWHARQAAFDPDHSPGVSAAAEPGEPLVSVCLSHFNRPGLLRQTLASIEAQDYRNFEVVLVDDASTQPEALAYIDSLAPKFAERGWQLIRNPEELFVGAARNIAARHARGEYLKFIDDDNVAKSHELSTFVKVARRTRADIVSCALDYFSGDEEPKTGQSPKFRFLFLGPAIAAGALRNYYGDTNSLFRRGVFLKLGGFHEERRVGNEDWKIIGDAVLKGYRLEAVSDALVWYRRTGSGDNASARNSFQGGHLQNIQPYLDAVRPELRNLILYTQGVSLRGDTPLSEVLPYVQLTTCWKSKLEAGLALIAIDQRAAAAKLMLDGVKAVQACGSPRVILEALVEIAPHLGRLDPGRARYLLGIAVKLAESHQRVRELKLAQRLISELPAITVIPPQAKLEPAHVR